MLRRRTGDDVLLPAAWRSTAAVTALAGAATTAALGWWFAGRTHAGRIDRGLAGLVPMRDGVAKTVGQALANVGNPVPIAVALGALAVLAHRVGGRRGLVLVAVGPPLAMVTTSVVLKPLVDRTYHGGLAFPSGHTTAVASLAVGAAVLVVGRTAVPPAVRLLAVVPLAGITVAVGASMVGRGYHYPTDTVGAVGVALATVLGVALAIDPAVDAVRAHRAATAEVNGSSPRRSAR